MCDLRPALCAAMLVALVGAGCVPTLDDNPAPDMRRDLPASFPGAETAAAAPEPGAGSRDWSDFFESPTLRALIEAALRGNQELDLRVQEIILARNEAAARRGEYQPKVGAGVRAGGEHAGEHTRSGQVDEQLDLPKTMGDFQFGLVASWEIDAWGKLRNAADAAELRAAAEVEGRNFLVTELVAEIARSYYELIALDNQIAVLNRNIAIQSDALEIVRIEKLAARVTELAVQRFEAEVLKNRSRLYDLEQERVHAENRINFLVGRYPRTIERQVADLDVPLPDVVQTGLPSELLENRPDVRAADLQLRAARLDVASARASFYPSLGFDAALGYQAFHLRELLETPESIFYGLASNLTVPLINRAQIESRYRSANALQIQAIVRYEQTLLQAVVDVVNQIASLENLKQGYQLQAQQVEKLDSSVEVSTVLFQSARADYVEILLTRRDSLEAQMDLIDTKKRLLQAKIGIYQALGGGWRHEP
ncbi:MAG: TolC family protein [Planctomycetes bacterium]|nr:TolC family protein [Planctomycetota bacterium]